MRSTQGYDAERGFTLVELLIVIVVLAILAGIAVLAVSGMREDAAEACSSANERVDATRDGAAAVGNGTPPPIIAGGTCPST